MQCFQKKEIFTKRFIFVPLHWLLCIIINPGRMNEFDPNAEEKETEIPFMVFGCIEVSFLERNCE